MSESVQVDDSDTPVTPIDVDEETEQCRRKRKLTSVVWDHFTSITVNGTKKAQCNYCKTGFLAKSSNGTSSLKTHLKNKHPSKIDGGATQLTLNFGDKKKDGTMDLRNFKFDQETSRKDLAKMIILHEYPFSIVDHVAFRDFCKGLRPEFKMVSRTTIKKDCVEMFLEEKGTLYTKIENLESRISLTSDMWTSGQNKAYICLTGHYIDDEWELQKRILNFSQVKSRHTAVALSKIILEKLYKWNIDRKLMCIVLDNCKTNDALVREVLEKLDSSSDLVMDGKLFHVRCSAHIVNLIVQEGIETIQDIITKIRESVKYVKSSTIREEKFKEAAAHVKAPNKSVVLDVCTRWNSTFLMLETAIEFKDAFNRLAFIDTSYSHMPSQDEWENAIVVCECLRFFYEVTKEFSVTMHPSANYFFPHVCAMNTTIRDMCNSDVPFVSTMGERMLDKFSKYWEDASLVLSIASILDPCQKLETVEFYMSLIYGANGDEKVEEIKNSLMDIYNEYRLKFGCHVMVACGESGTSSLSSGNTTYAKKSAYVPGLANALDAYKKHLHRKSTAQPQKSDMQLYLEEVVHPKVNRFDILGWWKVNAPKYPLVSRMARDILSIPVSTVASESAFSTGGRVISPSRSSMHATTVEALICSQDWIRKKFEGAKVVDANLGTITDLDDGKVEVMAEAMTINDVDEF